MRNYKNIKLILLLFCLIAVSSVNAQDLDDILFETGMNDADPTAAPIDSLISLFLAAGAYFGVKKLQRKK